MKKLLISLCIIPLALSGCVNQKDESEENNIEETQQSSVKKNIFSYMSDSDNHFSLYIEENPSIEIVVPITMEMIEKVSEESDQYETQYFIDFKVDDTNNSQILSAKRISWKLGDSNPILVLKDYNVTNKQIKEIEANLGNESIRTSLTIYTNDNRSDVWKSLTVLAKKEME